MAWIQLTQKVKGSYGEILKKETKKKEEATLKGSNRNFSQKRDPDC